MRSPKKTGFGTRQWLRVGLVVIFSFASLIFTKTSVDPEAAALIFAGITATLLVLWVLCRMFTRFTLKKVFKSQERLLNQQRMDISESGVSGGAIDDTVTYSYKWSAFERSVELPDAFLLLPNATSFLRIPKDSLTPEAQNNIRVWSSSQ